MEAKSKQTIDFEACDNCGSTSINCSFCARCRTVRYCGRACQKEDWKKGHKLVCRPTDSSTPLPAPDIASGARKRGGLESDPVSLLFGATSITFESAPYTKVELSEVQKRFLNELTEIINNDTMGSKSKEAALHNKAQEVFDHFKNSSYNATSASVRAKRDLVDILEVIRVEKNPRDWNWINWALQGVGDDHWWYLP